ncbi:MAG: hypothetical protein U5O16_23425 [Rhodococcus sp. (in: high G+C Gram-positive bacteria)]|nr:hypothetical protein [Rhodococcus sp. (in: high G+C Gram-positive bacteria)]
MSTADAVLLGARLIFYVIGLAVTVIAVGTFVDWAAGLLAGDPE